MLKYLKALWQFCSYLFWPQWGRKPKQTQEESEYELEHK